MSRIGKLPIALPKGVEVKVSDKNLVTVKGAKRRINSKKWMLQLHSKNEEWKEMLTFVTSATEQKRHKAMHGLYRALVASMIKGVSEGYKTEQELVGVGFRAANKGQLLELTLGFSHNVSFDLPKEIKVTTATEKGKNPTIIMESADKQLIGMVASKIRSLRKPEPYKGKGIKFAGEILRRKAGKSAGK